MPFIRSIIFGLITMSIMHPHTKFTRNQTTDIQTDQRVFRAVVVSKLTYAAPACCGFTSSVDRQRIDAVLHRAVRSDLWTLSGKSDAHTFENLCNSADDELFSKIKTSPNHILMHSCHHHLSHHRTMVLDSVHILSSYLNAQLISLAVTS